MPDSKSFGVAGKMRQTSVRKMRYPNKSASGNHLSQNDPHPPEVDDKTPCSKLRGQARCSQSKPTAEGFSLSQLWLALTAVSTAPITALGAPNWMWCPLLGTAISFSLLDSSEGLAEWKRLRKSGRLRQ